MLVRGGTPYFGGRMDEYGQISVHTELGRHGTHTLICNNVTRELYSHDSSGQCGACMYVGMAAMDDGRDIDTWHRWLRDIWAW